MADLQQLLAEHAVGEWCAPVSGPEQGFRNKAKMVVSGSVEKPLLGMLHRDGTPEDLTDCPLYPASFEPVFAALKPFIARAGLTPYNVARKRGELKYLLLTESQIDGGMMLRFVLRSEAKLEQLRAALPWLQAQLPQLKVITANIQPVHMAIMEGEKRFSSPNSTRWPKTSTACRCGSARKASSRPTRRWRVRCTPPPATGCAR
jgi:23S rRNA (uracil747-C5)-methyltransferase